MNIQEYREAYRGIGSTQVRELIRDNADFRKQTETLYTAIFHEQLNKSCSNCWFDAFILLMRTDLNKLNAMKEKSFDLFAGVVLYDVVNHDNAKTVTHHNITDELALYHLSTNPACVDKFSRKPDNWAQLVADYVNSKNVQEKATERATEVKEEPVSEQPKSTAPVKRTQAKKTSKKK